MEPLEPFGNHLPVRIRFGEGVFASLPDVLAADRVSRPFLLVDAFLEPSPAVAPVLEKLSEAGRYVKAAGEPTVDEVEEAAEQLAASGADAVVAVGGGSVMDTAKTARLVAGQGGPYRRFVGGGVTYEPPRLPLVCVPTTAGTGSEVSGGAVITDGETGTKAGIANPLLRAQHALVDPELTYGLPPAATSYSGVDAIAQAIAAIAVTAHTPIGDAIALEAIRLGAAALPAAVRNGADRGARGRMMCASLMAGLSMNISDCGSEHSIAQAIGGRYHLPHGLTIGLVLAETMEHDRRAAPERFERIADAFGEPDDGSRDGSRAVRAVRRLLAELEFPTLESAGVGADDLDSLADAALADYFITVSPEPWSKADVVACYEQALAVRAR